MRRKKPEVMEVDHKRLRDVADRAKTSLDPQDAELIERVFDSYEYVAGLIGDKNMSIGRLQKMLFGAKTEKTKQVVRDAAKTSTAADAKPAQDAGETESDAESDRDGKPPPQGHGRNGADAYQGARRIEVAHASLCPGDACPECGRGTVYEKPPGVVVRITGQAPLAAMRYELQKLRCHLCGKVFTAELPEVAGSQKYDAKAAAMIGLLKYGSGLPFNRFAGLQRNLEIPLPASTQWDIVHAFAPRLVPAFEELIRQAAQGDVLHNDDTTVKILALMGDRRRESGDAPDRTGMFTSGVVATRGGERIALFFSGQRHAGENLAQVLQWRSAQLDAAIQMCDALSRNMPRELQTIIANCLAHARRQFVEVYDRFPEQCRTVLEALKVVYRNDAVARREKMTAGERLQLHQAHSQPAMTDLYDWLQRQFAEKLVEPNSALGGAINYMLRHWEKLTLFLRKAGAPLDNNICERALKKAILHRKNSLFYKTQNGARIGDLYMSLIHTCELNGANPLDYLTALLSHAAEVAARPADWLPWNYRATLGSFLPAA
jgi:transposase